MARLTEKQKRFVAEYLVDLNATQAATRAGYKDPNIGRQLITKNNVADAIQKALKKREQRTEITQDRVLAELAAIALTDRTQIAKVVKKQARNPIDGLPLFDDEGNAITYCDVEITPTDELSVDARRAIAGIKQGKHGIEVTLYDKLRALEMLCKHLGLMDKPENTEITDRLDGIIEGLKNAAK